MERGIATEINACHTPPTVLTTAVTETLPAIPAHRQLQQPFSLNGKMKGLIPFPTCISLKHSSSTKGLQSGQKLIAALKPLPFLWALMLL